MSKIDQPALLLGRSLLAFYFILPGVAKFAAWQTHIDLMHHHGSLLEKLAYKNLLFEDEGFIILTNEGKLLADKIASDLFIELDE